MPEIPKSVKKMLPIIYVIDTSGSMKGDRIAAVNEAMYECEHILKEKASELPDVEIKIGALKFSSGAQWITSSGLVSLEDFYWCDQTAAGVTDLGEAIKELESKLSRTGFLQSEVGYAVPVIIFMSDGYPGDDYKKAIKRANENNRWFKSAKKVAIGFGEADSKVLEEITGNSESVITANDLGTLKSLIVAISATASMLAGQSRLAGDGVEGGTIVGAAYGGLSEEDRNNLEYVIQGEEQIQPNWQQPDWNQQQSWNQPNDWSQQPNWNQPNDWNQQPNWNQPNDWSQQPNWNQPNDWNQQHGWNQPNDWQQQNGSNGGNTYDDMNEPATAVIDDPWNYDNWA